MSYSGLSGPRGGGGRGGPRGGGFRGGGMRMGGGFHGGGHHRGGGWRHGGRRFGRGFVGGHYGGGYPYGYWPEVYYLDSGYAPPPPGYRVECGQLDIPTRSLDAAVSTARELVSTSRRVCRIFDETDPRPVATVIWSDAERRPVVTVT